MKKAMSDAKDQPFHRSVENIDSDPAFAHKPSSKWRATVLLILLWLILFHGYYRSIEVTEISSIPEQPTVIIGGGVIGLSTAYFLALAKGDGSSITIIDNAPKLLISASGQSLGSIGVEVWPDEVVPLGKLSRRLHEQLVEDFDGRRNWAYAGLFTHDLRLRETTRDVDEDVEGDYPFPSWFKKSKRYVDKHVNPEAAHLRAREFAQFLRDQCEMLGVKILLETSATSVSIEHGALTSLVVQSAKESTIMPCHNLVIAAGAWSDRVLAELFPLSEYRIPMNSPRGDGGGSHHLMVRVPSSDTKKTYNDLFFLDRVVGHKMDITDYLGGDIYIGGYGDAMGPSVVPRSAVDAVPNNETINIMKELACQVLNIATPMELDVLEAEMAYLPSLTFGRPIVAQVPLKLLQGGSAEVRVMFAEPTIEEAEMGCCSRRIYGTQWLSWASKWIWAEKSMTVSRSRGSAMLSKRGLGALENTLATQGSTGGVFVNTGHASQGVTLAPGSGKVMSELILGMEPSVNISGLGFKEC